MASSPIRINEATAEKLCQLQYIGPRRAERIIRYREQVGPIRTVEQLAEASGLAFGQAREMASAIDLTRQRALNVIDLAVLVIILGASGSYLFWGGFHEGLGLSSPAEIVLNVSLLAIVSGCIIAICNTLLSGNPVLGLIATSLWISGVVLAAALALSTMLTGSEDPLSRHVLSIWRLMVFGAAVLTIQFLPGWLLDLIPGDIEQAAQFFDRAMLPLAISLAVFVYLVRNDQWTEEIFALWSGITFVQYGVALARGESAFVATLTNVQRSRLHFIVSEDGVRQVGPGSGRLAGRALVIVGLVLLGMAAAGVIQP